MTALLIFKLREPNRIGGSLMNEAADAIEKLEAENAQLKAELAAMRDQKPVAWGWKKSNGVIYDTICADEHDRHEGEYLTPLYEAAGAKL